MACITDELASPKKVMWNKISDGTGSVKGVKVEIFKIFLYNDSVLAYFDKSFHIFCLLEQLSSQSVSWSEANYSLPVICGITFYCSSGIFSRVTLPTWRMFTCSKNQQSISLSREKFFYSNASFKGGNCSL